MATQIAPLTDAAYTAEQAVLTDTIANEVYAAHYNERKTSRIIIGGLSVLLLGSFASIVALAHKPVINRYIRIDEMGKAQAIVYSDLNYSPREGEVRTYLTDWTNYRYTLNRETVAKKYPLNYYFLSQQLALQLMGEDNANHTISQVTAGQTEQSEVDVRNVTITSMSTEQVQGAVMAKGTALVNFDKLFSVRNSRQPRTEHWMLSVTYYLNPQAGIRPGEGLSAVRDDQSAWPDRDGVPREPSWRRSHRHRRSSTSEAPAHRCYTAGT